MLSKEARHLIKCILDKDFITRYSIEGMSSIFAMKIYNIIIEIKAHPWIRDEFDEEEKYAININ